MELPDLLSTEPTAMPVWKRAAFLVGGWLCLLLGVVGWLVPVITGVPFYVLGFVLLGLASPLAARWINAFERRMPRRARLALRRVMRDRSKLPPGP